MMIGIGAVEVNGRPSRAGGMVVKNVSGFDMMKLYHGSFGTLAVIVSADIQTHSDSSGDCYRDCDVCAYDTGAGLYWGCDGYATYAGDL
jgi:hypothetical protein